VWVFFHRQKAEVRKAEGRKQTSTDPASVERRLVGYLVCNGRPSTDPASVEGRLVGYRVGTAWCPSTDPVSVKAAAA